MVSDKEKRNYVPVIDLLRGLSCLGVLFYHLRVDLWIGWHEIQNNPEKYSLYRLDRIDGGLIQESKSISDFVETLRQWAAESSPLKQWNSNVSGVSFNRISRDNKDNPVVVELMDFLEKNNLN